METLGIILILVLLSIRGSLKNIYSALDDIAYELRKRNNKGGK
jgi:hypothetical protein